MVVHRVGVGNQTLILCKSSKALNTEVSLQAPRFYHFQVLECVKTMGTFEFELYFTLEEKYEISGWERVELTYGLKKHLCNKLTRCGVVWRVLIINLIPF